MSYMFPNKYGNGAVAASTPDDGQAQLQLMRPGNLEKKRAEDCETIF